MIYSNEKNNITKDREDLIKAKTIIQKKRKLQFTKTNVFLTHNYKAS